MELKLPIIFLLIISSTLLSNNVQAFTVYDLLSNQNITASEIQQAVDNGSIQYSDLPGSFQVNIHAAGETISQPTKAITDNSMPCSNTKSDNSSIGLVVMFAILLLPVIILILTGHIALASLFRIKSTPKETPRQYKLNPDRQGALPKGWVNEAEPVNTKPIHPPHAKLLLLLGIIRVKKDNA